jgi:hypothetical protein
MAKKIKKIVTNTDCSGLKSTVETRKTIKKKKKGKTGKKMSDGDLNGPAYTVTSTAGPAPVATDYIQMEYPKSEPSIGINVAQGELDKKSLHRLTDCIISILEVEGVGDDPKVEAMRVLGRCMEAAPVSISGCNLEMK